MLSAPKLFLQNLKGKPVRGQGNYSRTFIMLESEAGTAEVLSQVFATTAVLNHSDGRRVNHEFYLSALPISLTILLFLLKMESVSTG